MFGCAYKGLIHTTGDFTYVILSNRLFTNPSSSSASSTTLRKRRALPASEVAAAVLKSSPVPISDAEVYDSIEMLVKLCPFFLRQLQIGGEEWVEMPAQNTSSNPQDKSDATPRKPPSSSGKVRSKDESAEALRTRSPRTVKREAGGLREVRERIRRELELAE